MRVILDPIALLMPPLVVLIGIVEVQVFGKLLAKAEGSTALSFVLLPMEF